MFRTLGLRHLCVVSKHNVVLGIVTRADLASAHELADSKSAISIRRNKKKEGKQDFLQHTINIDLQDGKSLDEFLR